MTQSANTAKMHLILVIIIHYIHYQQQNITKNKNSQQLLQDLKEIGEDLVIFKIKLGYVEEQLCVAVSVTVIKIQSSMVDVQQTYQQCTIRGE